MEFHEIMHELFNSIGDDFEGKQEVFFREVINNLVDEDTDGIANSFTKSMISKYMSGENFSKQSKKIIRHLDITRFIEFLNIHLDNDDQINLLCNILKEKNIVINNFDPSEDIANLLIKSLQEIKPNKKKNKRISNIDLTRSSLATAALSNDKNEFLNTLDMAERNIQAADLVLNSKLPKNISDDWGYRTVRTSKGLYPELLPKNDNALKNHKICTKYYFNNQEEVDVFLRTMQKSGLLQQFNEIHPKKVERYIDDFKDEYYDSERYKHYVCLAKEELPELNMNLSLDNGRFKLFFDNIILKKVKVDGNFLILDNKDDDNWMYISLKIDLTDYENGKASQQFNIGIKTKYLNNVDYMKDFIIGNYLMNGSNTHIEFVNGANNAKFIDTTFSDRRNYTKEDYNQMDLYLSGFDKISEIQNILNVKFNFNLEEYDYTLPTYDIAYACVKEQPITINREMNVNILVPDEEIDNYVIGDTKNRSNKTDHMILFDQVIYFKERLISLKCTKTIDKFDKDGMHHAIVNTKIVEIK